MQWSTWDAFWAMGGYGLYVWGSFAVTALVIAMEVVLLRKSGRQAVQRLKRLSKWEEE